MSDQNVEYYMKGYEGGMKVGREEVELLSVALDTVSYYAAMNQDCTHCIVEEDNPGVCDEMCTDCAHDIRKAAIKRAEIKLAQIEIDRCALQAKMGKREE